MTDGLLLVHAFPLDSRMWKDQVEAFQGVSIVAVDLPGFGGSPLAGDLMTMQAGAQRCVEALSQAGIDRAVVCGLSMGGYVAFELWRRHRERFAGLVLANTRAEPDTGEGKERRREVAELVRAGGSEAILEPMRVLVSENPAPELWDRVAEIVGGQPKEAIAAASLGMAERPDSRPDLPGIDVPALVITSTGDRLIAPEVSAPMADAIPEAKIEVIEGAGHLSNMEAPDEFNELLAHHLVRCGLTAP
jgi:pimeloyl-ACP methyl ester carboxylesterase